MGLSGKRRTWLLAAFGLAAGLLCAWMAIVVLALVEATTDLNDGRKAVDEARHRDPLSLLDDSTTDLLRRAGDRFAAAHDRLGSPVLLPAKVLPVVGRNLRSAQTLSAAASRIATIGISSLDEARTILEQPSGQGTARVLLVRQISDLANRTDSRLSGLDLGPRAALAGPLAEARRELEEGVVELKRSLTDASATAATVAGLLSGPSRYLVLGANNAEMRAGSGMFLSVGELETHDGAIRLGDLRSVNDVDVPPGVAVTGDLADRWGWLTPGRFWQNLMPSPRFEESARLAAEMWVAAGNGPVDGVLSVDPVALRELLAVTGPVTLEDRRIDSENVIEELVYRQYARFSGDQAERREELGRIARSTFAALDGGGWSPVDLASGLRKAVAGRHLMAWSSKPEQQAGWDAAGATGRLRPESLLVSVLNRGASKLDRWLGIDANLTIDPTENGTQCTLQLVLENTVPPDAPPYVLGPYEGVSVPEGAYLGVLAITLPGGAVDARIDGVDQLAVAGPDGPTRVIGFQLLVPRMATLELTVRFRLPGNHGLLRVEPSARVPAMAWRSGATVWDDGASHRLRW